MGHVTYIRMKQTSLIVVSIITLGSMRPAAAQDFSFSWERATVYSVTTERFADEEVSNDTGSTNGRGFAGLISKIEEGYFEDLGVNVLSISAPYEQVPDRVDPGDRPPSTDLGIDDGFNSFLDAARGHGLRVVVDINLGLADSTANQVIRWLADWVNTYGIDGFRVDVVEGVDTAVFARLKAQAVSALRLWKYENPTRALDDLDFWMTGVVSGHGPARSEYFDSGFDSVLNFDFQSSAGEPLRLEAIYADYSRQMSTEPAFNLLSFISSRDTGLFDRSDLVDAGTALLLAPGSIQILYGDETGRPEGPSAGNPAGATRSVMNWDSIDSKVQSHWQTLGKFRQEHPAVASGSHEELSIEPYSFYRGIRIGPNIDLVIIVMGATEKVRLYVSRIFPDDTVLRDAYTGNISMVSFGEITFVPHENGVLLIEEVK